MRAGGIELRPYQRQMVGAALFAQREGVRRPAGVLPTGGGKSIVIGGVVREHVAERTALYRLTGGLTGRRAVVIAHREELILQNAKKIRAVAPELRVGIVKAAQDQTSCDVISASVQSLVSRRRGVPRWKTIRDVGLVVVDEAHHAAADTYLEVLAGFGCMDGSTGYPDVAYTNPWAYGVTATMIRGDEKALGDVWQDVYSGPNIAELIRDGWLVRPRGLRVRIPDLDLRKVRKSRGDYSDGSLGEAIEGSMAPELVAKAYAEHAPGRQGILFAPTVRTAELYRDALRELGITADLITGKTPDDERRDTIKRFEDGRVQVLCNCMVLTEGTDLPMAEVCVIGRPTMNKGLLIQMVGRVLRTHPGKDSALILDVSGATQRHSLLGTVDLFGEEGLRVPVEGEDPGEGPPLEALADLDLVAATDLDKDLDSQEEIWLTGPTEAIEVDLFHGSKSLWRRTEGGIWFLSAVDTKRNTHRYVIVQRGHAGGWDVIEMDAGRLGRSSWVAQGVDDLSFAMAYGEGNVLPSELMAVRKRERWRDRPMSPAQQNKAAHMGIERRPGMTQGELADAIEVVQASARIDPYVPAYARRGM